METSLLLRTASPEQMLRCRWSGVFIVHGHVPTLLVILHADAVDGALRCDAMLSSQSLARPLNGIKREGGAPTTHPIHLLTLCDNIIQ